MRAWPRAPLATCCYFCRSGSGAQAIRHPPHFRIPKSPFSEPGLRSNTFTNRSLDNSANRIYSLRQFRRRLFAQVFNSKKMAGHGWWVCRQKSVGKGSKLHRIFIFIEGAVSSKTKYLLLKSAYPSAPHLLMNTWLVGKARSNSLSFSSKMIDRKTLFSIVEKGQNS